MGDGAVRVGLLALRTGPFFMLIVLCAVMAALTPLFLTERNLTNLGYQSAAISVLALGQFVVIVTRGVDLSVGSTLGLTVGLGAVLYGHDWGTGLILFAMLACGGAVGAVNGLIFVKGRLPEAFLVTLATYGMVRGVAFLVTGGNVLPGQPAFFETLGGAAVGPVPYATLLVGALIVILWVLTKRMSWGRWIYAIGGNPDGAVRAGINVDLVLISVYIFSGVMAGIAGVITAGQIGVGDANAGTLFELQAITAVILGGTSFLGGRGGVANAIVGALMVTIIQNGLNLLNVNGYWELIAIGTATLAAIEMNVLRTHFEERFRVLQASSVEQENE